MFLTKNFWFDSDILFNGFNSAFNLNDNFKVDISEDEKATYIEAEMPGIDKSNIKLSIEKDILTIRYEKATKKENKGKVIYRIERFKGDSTRSFILSENVDCENITANYENGVLVVTLPKKEMKNNSREIAIN